MTEIKHGNTTHGLTGHILYSRWRSERQRCYDSNHKAYCNYGGRGIYISDEFHDFKTWLDYIESLPDAYKKDYSIDRIDNDGNYERGNLRWASPKEQSNNQRVLMRNNTSGYRGVSYKKKSGKFFATVYIDGKNKHLGMFDKAEDGAIAYDKYVLDNKLNKPTNGIKEL